MPSIPHRIPARIPSVLSGIAPPPSPTSDPFSLYDVAIGGVGFEYATTVDNPMERATVDYTQQRVDQATTAGEQTLSSWWIKSQDSWHGGAGQLQLEPAVVTPVTHVRYDCSKNVDPFTPGRVTRLPDTVLITADDVTAMVGLQHAGVDLAAYLTTAGHVRHINATAGTPTPTTYAAVSSIQSIATDGAFIYASDATNIYKLDPGSPGSTVTVATFPTPRTGPTVLGWVKARLMAAGDGAVYQVDVSQTGVTLGTSEFLYQHPTPGWTWRCFSTSPTAVLAAGDATGVSTITQFTAQNVDSAPVLGVDGEIGEMPIGERILSMRNTMGTYLAIGTTRGVRIGQFDSYFSRLTYGPLTLLPTDPEIPAVGLLSRDRFVFAIGRDYDEAGVLALDLGTVIDQANRYAWSPHLVCPTPQTTTAATAGCVLPLSNRIVYSVGGVGVFIEGTSPGEVREAWLRTSRIRYGTTEPKLFKLARVRGDLTTGEVQVSSITPDGTTVLLTQGFRTDDPPEFTLPAGTEEWLQMKLALLGGPAQLFSYGVKALPGTRRQRHIKLVLAIFDTETTKSGQRIRDELSARGRLAQLEAMDASGDEVTLQEFTPQGVVAQVVVIERIDFSQTGRPTRQSDIGGTVTVLLRTVDS